MIAVIWASLDTLSFSELLNVTSNSIDLYLIDKGGNLVAGKSEENNFFELISNYEGNDDAANNLKNDIEQFKSNFQYFEYKGKEVYMYYQNIENKVYSDENEWWLLVRVPISTVNAMANDITDFLNKISITLIILFTLGFFVFFSKISKVSSKVKVSCLYRCYNWWKK